jgi:hypothetical protein
MRRWSGERKRIAGVREGNAQCIATGNGRGALSLIRRESFVDCESAQSTS